MLGSACPPKQQPIHIITEHFGMLHSPRVFWSLVHHASVGPGRSFREGYEAVLPEAEADGGVDWAKVFTRARQARYDSLEWAMK